jgi:hypothetical protein
MAAISTTPVVDPDVMQDRSRLAEFLALPQFGRIQAMYVSLWCLLPRVCWGSRCLTV